MANATVSATCLRPASSNTMFDIYTPRIINTYGNEGFKDSIHPATNDATKRSVRYNPVRPSVRPACRVSAFIPGPKGFLLTIWDGDRDGSDRCRVVSTAGYIMSPIYKPFPHASWQFPSVLSIHKLGGTSWQLSGRPGAEPP